jgi:hypothetical protein
MDSTVSLPARRLDRLGEHGRYICAVYVSVNTYKSDVYPAQKTKTLVVVAVGGIVPVAVGNTRVPRIVVPASTPVDAFGAFSHLAVCAKTFAKEYNLPALSKR